MRHYELMKVAEMIEESRDELAQAQNAAKPLHVSVTDPLAAALVEIDRSLGALDGVIGTSARREHRERPREMEMPRP